MSSGTRSTETQGRGRHRESRGRGDTTRSRGQGGDEGGRGTRGQSQVEVEQSQGGVERMRGIGSQMRNGSGRWTGRPRGRGNFARTRPPSGVGRSRKPRKFNEDLNPTSIHTIPKPGIPEGTGNEDLEVQNLSCIGSYSWINSDQPTILVPGAPRIWRERPLPYSVNPDSWSFVDQNASRFPSCPLLPLFRAVEFAQREPETNRVNWVEVDFVTDRNSLRKLLRWVSGENQEFRIDIQLAGIKTVLFTRFEQRVLATSAGGTGYGYNFEKESTTEVPGCEETTGYHRVVKYDFDGLTLVVRFEVDACLMDDEGISEPVVCDSSDPTNDLSNSLASLTISPSSSNTLVSSGDLNIIGAGRTVPQHNIVELVTCSRNELKWGKKYPQIFLSQTPHIFLAVHDDGNFHTVVKHSLRPPATMVQKNYDVKFRKLGAALRRIQEFIIDHGKKDCQLSLLLQGGELKVYEHRSKRGLLPDDIMAWFGV
ncbi:hypothetical protein C8Q75DRAFT_810811 [Abortiporus biennis]|nr:hypothetical protein C8Q75DRAFT_810811 [Abortiporus biennis]